MSDPTTHAPEFARTFVPADADLGDWAQIEPLFDRLDAMPLESSDAVENLLLALSELASCVGEVSAMRHIEMTCDTENKEKLARFMHFVETIDPKSKPRWHALEEKLVASPHFDALPDARYFVLKRAVRAGVQLYREENVALSVELDTLGQQYQQVTGAMSVQFQGKEQTLPQMARYQEEADRSVRQEAWELTATRRLKDRETLDDQFDQMFRLRVKIATNAGYPNHRDYAFVERGRFDYSPADCERFHEAVETSVLPLVRSIHESRQAELGVDTLRPWDLSVDTKNRPPLRPFETSEQLIAGCHAIFAKIDPDLDKGFGRMRAMGRLDLDSRKGKAPGGYQANLEETRIPFIFMNAVGMQNDLRVLLHEGGHAFHTLVSREDPLVQYRSAPMEFCEVASMSMELLGDPHLETFYSSEEDLIRARRDQLEGVIGLFPWVAQVDAFQHWLYTHPDHTRDERTDCWRGLSERFTAGVDWTGYEEIRDAQWQRQLHIFLMPFYYIEYGIAQLGALQVWQNALRDRSKAIADYKAALTLGGSRTLPDLFKAANIRFDFSNETIAPLMDGVRQALAAL